MIRVLIPSCNDDLLIGCFQSMERMQVGSWYSAIVADNGLTDAMRGFWPANYCTVPHRPFVINAAFNSAARRAGSQDDFLLTNDDIEFLTPNWLLHIEALLAAWPREYGLLNLAATTTEATYGRFPGDAPIEAPTTLSFVATLIPRWIWDEIGPLDQEYVGYGWDDTDYFLRVLHAGYKIGITGAATIRHTGTVAFKRAGLTKEQGRLNYDRFHAKWGLVPDPGREFKFLPAAPHFRRQSCECARQ